MHTSNKHTQILRQVIHALKNYEKVYNLHLKGPKVNSTESRPKNCNVQK